MKTSHFSRKRWNGSSVKPLFFHSQTLGTGQWVCCYSTEEEWERWKLAMWTTQKSCFLQNFDLVDFPDPHIGENMDELVNSDRQAGQHRSFHSVGVDRNVMERVWGRTGPKTSCNTLNDRRRTGPPAFGRIFSQYTRGDLPAPKNVSTLPSKFCARNNPFTKNWNNRMKEWNHLRQFGVQKGCAIS